MPAALSLSDTLPLPNSSVRIPRLGFGVYRSSPEVCVQSCLTALEVGYRHIDTAQFYGNETQVGEAVKKSGLPRSEIFVTTKILSAGGSVEKSYQKCLDSVEKIGGSGGYVDLFLIHSPNAGSKARKEMWLALEKLYEEGKAKSIGVSNFGVGHIAEMKGYAKVWPPHVNQIELHPWCQQRTITDYCKKHGIVIEAYSPLVRNYKANDPTLVSLAQKYNKSTAQILIRYCLQKDWVPLPKSDNPDRIRQNADVYGFDISKDDMDTLDGLDEGDAGAIVQAVSND
ncbi:putative oxidoreductase C2F3.05c [Exophiala dermatitidis]|uniref:D-xylose reductase [NAD(P)H] n=1 Tax=Exophiala dermatitidis (strain ATCC 34100 / CBS 525.76 / NIH/UT8656) TaxID=858893 RepID=H6C7Z7_EXODN|nr:aldo-keto reductase [Exophiala dermatitidis NIH/UT8656]EHY60224.1 aldo-keto reductase [Exophiala dermatitidis NIH/UT8656]